MAGLALIWLGVLPIARAAAPGAHLAVSFLASEGAAIELRLRIGAAFEPTMDLAAISPSGERRLTLAWPAALALDAPLPDLGGRGAGRLKSIVLRGDDGTGRLELLFAGPVDAQLRRAGDSWVLRLDPLAPPAGADPPVSHAAVPPAQPAAGPGAPAAPAAAGGPAPASASAAEQLLVDVAVNGRPLADVVHVERVAGGALLLPLDAWTEARLTPGPATMAMSDGTPARRLDEIPGATWEVDRQTLRLQVTVPASFLAASSFGERAAAVAPPPRPRPGAMLNYDVSASHAPNTPAQTGALLEAVGFGPAGELVSSALLRRDGGASSMQRLDTYWRYDMPGRMEALVLGDTVGVGGGWSRPVRFAGLRWGRDFSMRPGFVTQPQVSLDGSAALPSTVEVLVNNVRRVSQPVPPGPFELTNVPVVTGAGDINLVVRDLLGRETVVTQRYYASPRLLAPGLTDFSLEAGRMRFGYGRDSHYRDAFAAATLRAGVTNNLTAEARAEVQDGRRAGGIELAGLLGQFAVARVALAASHGGQAPDARGQLLQAGVERITAHGSSALAYEHASAGFAPFGEPAGAAPSQRPRQRLLASVGGPLAGTLGGGISYVRQTSWDGERVTLAGLSLSMPAWQRASMNLSLNKRLDGEHDWRAAFMVNLPVDQGLQAAARVDRDSSHPATGSVSAARAAPAGPGLGWLVEASSLESRRARAALQYNTSFAELGGELASDAHGVLAQRVGARGTFGLLEAMPFASRPVGQGSFAVVDVAGLADVPVMRSHQVVATTGAGGRAFVAGLLPWQANRLEIDPGDLPLDATVDDVAHDVTPYARSGALVSFSVKRSRQALLVLRRPGGRPVPDGAKVRLLPDGPEFIAGLRGEVWLTDLPAGAVRIEASWPGDGCTVALPARPAGDAPERIGPLDCGKAAP